MDTIKELHPLRIGLTGGIASGKSTVAKYFKQLGVPIIDADVIAHQLTEPNTEALNAIIAHFGEDFLNEDQSLNRKKLRNIIFENPHEKKWLEDLLHPLIRKGIKTEIKSITAPYCICVIPLLAESESTDYIDRVLVVDSPAELQIKRASQRDSASKEAIKKIMHAQTKNEKRLAIADDVLDNTGDLETLEVNVLHLHEQYLQLAEKHN